MRCETLFGFARSSSSGKIQPMQIAIRGAWILAVLGALAGMYVLISHTILQADTAEKQAQCAAVAISFALVPYCLARALEAIARR